MRYRGLIYNLAFTACTRRDTEMKRARTRNAYGVIFLYLFGQRLSCHYYLSPGQLRKQTARSYINCSKRRTHPSRRSPPASGRDAENTAGVASREITRTPKTAKGLPRLSVCRQTLGEY